jgi:hypothetical protein
MIKADSHPKLDFSLWIRVIKIYSLLLRLPRKAHPLVLGLDETVETPTRA